MENTKVENMNDIKVKLEDIRNSQSSLIEKIAKVMVDLFESPDADLETKLNEMHTNASNNADIARAVVEDYEIKINQIVNEMTE